MYYPKIPDPDHTNIPIKTPIAIPLNAPGAPAIDIAIPKTVVG